MGLRWGGSGRGGGGIELRTPPDEFTGGTLAEAIAARDHAMTGITDTSNFDANPNLAVILTATDPDPDVTYYFARRGNAWANVTNTVRGPSGRDGVDAVADIARFWGPGQTRAMPAAEASRSAMRLRAAGSVNALRYSTSQAAPSEVLVGVDRGIRALTAAQAADTDLLTQGDGSDEVLADYAVFDIPMGVVAEVRLVAQHDASADTTLSAFLLEVLAGDDDPVVMQGIGYAGGTRDPFGRIPNADTPRTRIECREIIDASAAARRITWIGSGFNVPNDLNGNWYLEFGVFHHA